MPWAVPNMDGPCHWHFLAGADALFAVEPYLAIFCGLTTPVVLVEAVEYAPVAPATRCSTATYWGWSGAKPETYTEQPWVALQLSRVSPSGGLAAGDLVYGLCCPLPVKLQTPLGTVRDLVAAEPLQYERNCS